MFKLVIYLVAVCLHIAVVITQQFTCNTTRTAATVIIEHDISCQTISDAPFITLSCLVFFVIKHRYHALVNLDVFAGQDVSGLSNRWTMADDNTR